MPEKIKAFGWFGAGWAVFKGVRDSDFYPPLDDMIAQREWLGGFGAAYAECPQYEEIDGELVDLGPPIEEELEFALEGRPALLLQLRQHGAGRQTVH